MEREVKNKAASIRAKIMNMARVEKIDFDFLLLRYFQERFLWGNTNQDRCNFRSSKKKITNGYWFWRCNHSSGYANRVSNFIRGKTSIPDNSLVFRSEFHRDEGRQKQWIVFLRKSRLYDVNREFNEIMERITAFLRPIVCSIKDKKTRKNKLGIL